MPPELRLLAEHQCGIVTKLQCRLHGMSLQEIDTKLTSGRWQRVSRGVFAVHTGALPDEAVVWAAVLAVTRGRPEVECAASHGTALWLARRVGDLPRPVHLAVPARTVIVPPPGVRVHRLERLGTVVGEPPRTTVESALLETIHLEARADRAVSLVCDYVGARLTTPGRLADALSLRPRQRWRSVLDQLLPDVEEGAQSPLELLDLRNDRNHGLPTGARQVSFRQGGLQRWMDVEVAVGGAVVTKELDGRLGHEGVARFKDWARDNSAVLRRASPLRFGWVDYVTDPCEVAAAQSLLWARLGTEGVGHNCRRKGCELATRVQRLAREIPMRLAS